MRKRLFMGLLVAASFFIIFNGELFSQEETKEDPIELMKALQKAFVKAGEKIAPSVVQIIVDRISEQKTPTPRKPLKIPRRPRKGRQRAAGIYQRPKGPVSGVIIEKDGYILTSWFNVSGSIKRIKVKTKDGKKYKAELLGRHEGKDIALLKIDAKDLPVPEFADSDKLKVGQFCIVVGRSQNLKKHSLTTGIISALDRLRQGAIQMDAETNYGNTGGALCDIQGRFIGIACHVHSRSRRGQNSGVSFAIPINRIKEILNDLKNKKIFKLPKRPILGVRSDIEAGDVKGAKIESVVPGSAAEKAGIKPGDIILEFDGKKIEGFLGLRKAISACKVGQKVKIKVKRKVKDEKGNEVEKEIELEAILQEGRRRR